MESKQGISLKMIIAIIIGSIINIGLKYLAASFELPFWLDSFGTIFVACVFGPVPGVVVGCISNLFYAIFDISSIPYTLTSITIALCATFFFPKKYNTFQIAFTGGMIAFFSVLISSPFNLIFFAGETGNKWGDALLELLRNQGVPLIISSILAEAFVDFPDKIITLSVVAVVIFGGRKYASSK